jgi:hypothetical protein
MTITQGGTTTLNFSISNPNATVALAGVGFTDTLPSGLVITTPNGLAGSCGGGTIAAKSGSNSISLTGATLAAGASCAFSVDVTGVTVGTQTNTTSRVASVNGGLGAAATATLIVGDVFQIRYTSNLDIGDGVINITNSGVNGASWFGPGLGGPVGNLCVNAYVFSPDEQLVSCCSCLVTPNGLASLSVNGDLVSNVLTGVRPNSVVVKLVGTGAGANFNGASCVNSAAFAGSGENPLAIGMLAWGTTARSIATRSGAFNVTETAFGPASLSAAELTSMTNRCAFIIGNSNPFGICRSCRAGGLGADRL